MNEKCPRCGAALNPWYRDGRWLNRCSHWPKCRYCDDLPEHIRLERLGAARLPGF